MKKKISIILLNYNSLQFNKNCIDSLLAQSYQSFEIIFVNNLSTDGSSEEVEKIFAHEITQGKITIIQPWHNTWFAMGNNIGVQHSDSKSEYICLLNNDVTVPKDWLENLVKGIESDSSLGAVWGMIYDQWYEDQIDDFLFVQHKKGINNYFFDSITVDQTEEDKQGNIIYTTGLSGCCLMYKKSLLKQPFDDMYFAYMEDTALCMKILLQWYRVGVIKNAIVHHFGSWSFGKKPTVFKVFHGQKNYILNFIVLSQWYRWIIILPFFIIWIAIRTLFGHQWIRVQGLAKAIWRILTHVPSIIALKKSIKRTISPWQFYKQLWAKSIDIPYYTNKAWWYNKIVSLLNIISTIYFRFFWLFIAWRGK